MAVGLWARAADDRTQLVVPAATGVGGGDVGRPGRVWHQIDATHRAVVVWDGAGAHTSTALVVPDGIDLVAVPPDAPELQPAERLWPLVDEAVATRSFADLETLMSALVPRCRTVRADRAPIRNLTRYHWWPSDAPLVILN